MPYIDEHRITIGATRERAWVALITTLRGFGRTVPTAFAWAWGLDPPGARGEWRSAPLVGDALPGFAVAASQPLSRLELRGRHRFSRYALVFELDQAGDAECILRARSFAEFAGVRGRAYRALVISSGAHRLLVPRLLEDVARRA